MTKYTFGIVFPRFMKTIHVELPDKTIDFLMPEILWKHDFLEFVDILNNKILARRPPKYNFAVFLILNNKCNTFKI